MENKDKFIDFESQYNDMVEIYKRSLTEVAPIQRNAVTFRMLLKKCARDL